MRPFRIHISDDQTDDLQRRLHGARLPGAIFKSGAEDGISLPFMHRLLDCWREEFDWRAQERRLNRLPQFTATVDGQEIHFTHSMLSCHRFPAPAFPRLRPKTGRAAAGSRIFGTG